MHQSNVTFQIYLRCFARIEWRDDLIYIKAKSFSDLNYLKYCHKFVNSILFSCLGLYLMRYLHVCAGKSGALFCGKFRRFHNTSSSIHYSSNRIVDAIRYSKTEISTWSVINHWWIMGETSKLDHHKRWGSLFVGR